MASFLQNNGDIILDAVLTDYGRRLLARGDGSFKIAKFAFGDDEIDYGLFKSKEVSVNQDVDIMNTPILEAFTNNAASMKSQLITLGIDNVLFLPVLKLKNNNDNTIGDFGTPSTVYSGYVVPIDSNINNTSTYSSYALTGTVQYSYIDGVLNVSNKHIVIDQGLDSDKLNSLQSLKDTSPMLYETEYNIYVDNRFCSVGKTIDGTLSSLRPLSVDDDNIAVYKLTEQSLMNNTTFVTQIKPDTDITKSNSVIAGTKGSRLMFTLVPNGNLLYTNTMFDKYGKILNLNSNQPSKQFRTLKMPVRVVGVTTGYSLDMNVMFAKVI